MPAPFDLSTDQLNVLNVRRRLRDAGNGGLVRELNKALKASADPVAEAERRAAQSLPSRGVTHSGLRQSIASAVAVRISTSQGNPGVVVYVKRDQVRGKLGRDTNRVRGWRHPVWGNRNNWVRQVMSPGWWGRAAAPGLNASREKFRAALDAIANRIAKG